MGQSWPIHLLDYCQNKWIHRYCSIYWWCRGKSYNICVFWRNCFGSFMGIRRPVWVGVHPIPFHTHALVRGWSRPARWIEAGMFNEQCSSRVTSTIMNYRLKAGLTTQYHDKRSPMALVGVKVWLLCWSVISMSAFSCYFVYCRYRRTKCGQMWLVIKNLKGND